MCLVLAFSNAKKLDIRKTANAVGPILLDDEPDGFGYSVEGAKGQFGEKYVGEAFKSRINSLSRVVKLPIVKKTHEFFGDASAPTGPAIFHGRTSTNDRGLLNCHPMRRDGWSLIHNGVVTDNGPAYKKLTTNDSEDVLKHLIVGIESVERYLTGYYAFAAIDPKGRLHVARDSSAYLHVAWSDKIESYVFATTAELLEDVNKKLQLECGPIDLVEDNVYMILNGNDLDHIQAIKPAGWGRREARHAEASLGRKLDASEYGEVYTYDRYQRDIAQAEAAVEGWPSEAGKFDREDSYYMWRHEVDNMDAGYRIYNEDGDPITLEHFRQLDHISQELCTIERPDGTYLDPEFSEYLKAE